MEAVTALQRARQEYYSLDPSAIVQADELLMLAETLDTPHGRNGGLGNITANIYLELSTHPEVTSKDSLRYARHASSILSARSVTGALCVPLYNAAPYRSHLPIFTDGINRETLRQVRSNTAETVADFIDNPDNRFSNIKGLVTETIITLLMGHTGLKGVVARPSFERQDRSGVTIGGQNYRWDVTVTSDGSDLKEGEYRVQVKTASHSTKGIFSRKPYHPDIAVIAGNEHLNVPSSQPQLLAQLCKRLLLLDSALPKDIARLRHGIMETLEQKGPIQPAAAPPLAYYPFVHLLSAHPGST